MSERGWGIITLQQAFLAFEESLASKPLSADAQGLYMRLLYYANKARVKTDSGWDFPEWFSVPQTQLMADMGIKERHKLYKIQEELILSGSIEMLKSKGRDTQYRISILPAEVKDKPVAKVKGGGSFDTDDFFSAAVMRSFGDDFDPEIIKN